MKNNWLNLMNILKKSNIDKNSVPLEEQKKI